VNLFKISIQFYYKPEE